MGGFKICRAKPSKPDKNEVSMNFILIEKHFYTQIVMIKTVFTAKAA